MGTVKKPRSGQSSFSGTVISPVSYQSVLDIISDKTGTKTQKSPPCGGLENAFGNTRKLSDGAGVQIRTGDLRITSALLYQLSYTGVKNGGPTEIRTQVLALKGRCPRPLDYGTASMVGREGVEPSTHGLKVRCSAN